MNLDTTRPLAAALIAATAWAALAMQAVASTHLTHSIPLALWSMSAYFTILTNLLVALVFTAVALNRTPRPAPSVVAGATLSIMLVGVIYALLLHGTLELSGGSVVANILLHMVTPVLVPLFWLALEPKGQLSPRDPLLWAVYPLLYLGYALIRGAATHRYPYPFLDVPHLGWAQVSFNAAAIAVGFLLTGYAVFWLDGRLRSATLQS